MGRRSVDDDLGFGAEAAHAEQDALPRRSRKWAGLRADWANNVSGPKHRDGEGFLHLPHGHWAVGAEGRHSPGARNALVLSD